MRFLVVFTALAASSVLGAPQGYSLPSPSGTNLFPGSSPGELSAISSDTFISDADVHLGKFHGSADDGAVISGTGVVINPQQGAENILEGNLEAGTTTDSDISFDNGVVTANIDRYEAECKEGEVRHVDGSCVVPVITRKVFVFTVPQQKEETEAPLPELPPPKVEHNILFVRLPEAGEGPEPIIVPPPRQNNIVYVLNKQIEQTPRVIEVSTPPPSEPEIYFINYEDGENPTLPGGVDLHTALGSASETTGEILGLIDTTSAVTGITTGTGDVTIDSSSIDQSIFHQSSTPSESGASSAESVFPQGLYETP